VIPYGERLALAELPEQGTPPPEWWLAQIGALPATRAAPEDGLEGRGAGATPPEPAVFSLGPQVRDLAARMEYVRAIFVQNDKTGLQRVVAYLDLLEKIFETHDPNNVADPAEKAWRMWVRLEIVEVVTSAMSTSGKAARRRRELRSALTQQLSTLKVPPEFNAQWQALTAPSK
jgi:hypothetical protein